MNRRTFIKTTGIISLLGLTNLSFAEKKKELKWIKMTDQMPEMGRNTIVLHIKRPGCFKADPHFVLSIGRRVQHHRYSFMMEAEIVYFCSKYATEPVGIKRLYYHSDRKFYGIKEIHRVKWLNYKSVKAYGEGSNPMPIALFEVNNNSSIKDNLWWMSIGSSLPENLPAFPKYRSNKYK